jgi:hypothetical protein
VDIFLQVFAIRDDQVLKLGVMGIIATNLQQLQGHIV